MTPVQDANLGAVVGPICSDDRVHSFTCCCLGVAPITRPTQRPVHRDDAIHDLVIHLAPSEPSDDAYRFQMFQLSVGKAELVPIYFRVARTLWRSRVPNLSWRV